MFCSGRLHSLLRHDRPQCCLRQSSRTRACHAKNASWRAVQDSAPFCGYLMVLPMDDYNACCLLACRTSRLHAVPASLRTGRYCVVCAYEQWRACLFNAPWTVSQPRATSFIALEFCMEQVNASTGGPRCCSGTLILRIKWRNA